MVDYIIANKPAIFPSTVAPNETINSSALWTTSLPPTTADAYSPATISVGNNSLHPCLWILYEDVNNSGVRAWDVALVIPNTLFLLFLLLTLKQAYGKLKHSDSPIFTLFYILVFLVAVISVIRCVVSMTVNAATDVGSDIDKILWLVLKFFLLATELSVLIFGLAFGHLDSKSSIKRVLIVTTFVAFTYSVTQGVLELVYPDHRLQAANKNFGVYAHGGMLFWFVSSTFFFLVYTCVFLLPFTKLKEKIQLPSKTSFYVYVLILALLNLLQAVGSILLYKDVQAGLCLVDVTTYLYFTCFAPLVYCTFLMEFLRAPASTIFFSYKAQTEEADDEVHQIPNAYISSPKDHDILGYDSTEFDGQSSMLVINSTDVPPIIVDI
ncbi:transmembrane protein adipocyte-associated 1 homolog [Saccoglossus kowalevskii]|uniref:Transmembrane protein adipocyte-associated 1 homolog n=1 Tax=Saccoglossus kowalevskii TaxID=10224 RepID=A0ABM0MTZ1_SACKO|nr:PREDICTED: transmembrane protein adipocyte-associated 1 homolog [Saccoglossus kowalevskii]